MKAVSAAIAVLFAMTLVLGMMAPAPGAIPSASYDWGTCVRGSMSSDASTTKYFVNGSTAGGCETELVVFNPSATQSAGVSFFFITSSGTSTGPSVTVPALSSSRIIASDYIEGSEFSTRVVATIPVVAERNTFGPDRVWATSSTGSMFTSTTWYFVGGCTAYGQETLLTVQNPNPVAATVDINFSTASGPVAGPQDVPVGGNSRLTIDLGDSITNAGFSTAVTSTGGIVCEQSLFGNSRGWSDDCIGEMMLPGSGSIQYLAEGAVSGDYKTSIEAYNCEGTAGNLTLDFFDADGSAGTHTETAIPAYGVRLVPLDTCLTDAPAFSTLISGTRGFLCQRMMSDGYPAKWMHGLMTGTAGSTSCYFPNGSTRDGREDLVSLINVGTSDTTYDMTLYFDDGTTLTHSGSMRVNRNVTVDMNDLVGASRDYSMVVKSGSQPIVAEMSSYGNMLHHITASAGEGGSITPSGTVSVAGGEDQAFAITPDDGYHVADVLVDGASVGAVESYTFTDVTADHTIAASFISDLATWYLAEGSTDWGFDCYISIVNPNEEAVDVAITYMTSSGETTGPTVHMPAQSQATVLPRQTLGAADFSTRLLCQQGEAISVDRTMYWTGPTSYVSEAHCATGVTAPATTWYLPEGSSDWGFECFLLIQNPNAETANCKVTWMIQGAGAQESEYAIAAGSRATFNMADAIGAADSSIKVESDIPVIPERAMYRNDRREGHDSTGTTTAAADYYLAEGCTGFGFTTWVLVQNPNDTETEVAVAYQSAVGLVEGPTFTMPGRSRYSINVNETTVIPGDDPSSPPTCTGRNPSSPSGPCTGTAGPTQPRSATTPSGWTPPTPPGTWPTVK